MFHAIKILSAIICQFFSLIIKIDCTFQIQTLKKDLFNSSTIFNTFKTISSSQTFQFLSNLPIFHTFKKIHTLKKFVTPSKISNIKKIFHTFTFLSYLYIFNTSTFLTTFQKISHLHIFFTPFIFFIPPDSIFDFWTRIVLLVVFHVVKILSATSKFLFD